MILSSVSTLSAGPNFALPHTQPPFLHVECQSEDSSDEELCGSNWEPPIDLASALRRIKFLEGKFNQEKRDFADYRKLVAKSLDVEKLAEAVASTSITNPIAPKRDDDSHYFTSYGSNGTRDPPIYHPR